MLFPGCREANHRPPEKGLHSRPTLSEIMLIIRDPVWQERYHDDFIIPVDLPDDIDEAS